MNAGSIELIWDSVRLVGLPFRARIPILMSDRKIRACDDSNI